MMLVFATFCALTAAALLREDGFERLRAKPGADWALDLSGLAVQGVLVPALQTTALFFLLSRLAPASRGCLDLPAAAAFLLNFVGIDYLYYWNHRLLHGPLWRWHAVHHTAPALDVWVTGRNTLWTPLLIVYVWANAACLFLLKDPAAFLFAAALTAALDLWRHSEAAPRRPGPLYRAIATVLITPGDHAWHHSSTLPDVNYGANLKLWDRLHGTYHGPGRSPERLGVALDWSWSRRLLYPA